jgi:hypothetical protein
MLVVLALELTVVFGQVEKLTDVLALELIVVLALELTVVFGQVEKLIVVLALELTLVFGKPFLVETVDYNNHPLELESDHHFLQP